MKTVIIESIISPYEIARFNHVKDILRGDLVVLFQSESEKIRNWRLKPKTIKFTYEVLPDISLKMIGKDIFTLHLNYTVFSELKKIKPDVVISCGWSSLASYLSLVYCWVYRKKYILWAGSTACETSWRRSITKPLVRFLVKKCSAFIAYGTRAKEYLMQLGADQDKIFIGWNSVDNSYFESNSRITDAGKKKIKSELGIRTKRVILYVGRLSEKKGVHDLLTAFSSLKNDTCDVTLLLVGAGIDEPLLRKRCEREGLHEVVFTGFIDYDQLPQYFGISDLFVLPSRDDIWGLVINEAMASGLPVITTNKVGASVDLIRDGVNGFVINDSAPVELHAAISTIINDDGLRHSMARSSRMIIKDFDIHQTAEGIRKAAEFAFGKP